MRALKKFVPLFMRSVFAAALLYFPANNSLISNSFANANESLQFGEIKLSPFRQVALKQISQLKMQGIDILGVNHGLRILSVRMTPSQFNWVFENGFDASFNSSFDTDYSSKAYGLLNDVNTKDLEKYSDPDEVVEQLKSLASKYPEKARVIDIGKTTEGRSILGLEISDQSEVASSSLPAVVFAGMLHARELMTTEVVLDAANFLLEETSEEVQAWRKNLRIVLLPQLNPDGNIRVHDGERLWRKNAWKDNGNVVGVDLNRNFPATWNACNGSSGNKFADDFRGLSAGSEPETQNFMKFLTKYKPVMSITYHSFSELIIFPYGCRSEKNPSYEEFKLLGNKMNEEIENDNGQKNSYEVGTPPEVIYQADGSDLDWQFKTLGTLAYTIEINSSRLGFQPDFDTWRQVTVKRQRGAWQQMLRAASERTLTFNYEVEPGTTATMQIFKKQFGELLPWSADHETVGLRQIFNSEVVHQALGKGQFVLKIEDSAGKVLVREFEIKETSVSLGKIN